MWLLSKRGPSPLRLPLRVSPGRCDDGAPRYIGSRVASCWAHNAPSYAKHASLVLRERARPLCVPIFIMHYLQLRNPERFLSSSLSPSLSISIFPFLRGTEVPPSHHPSRFSPRLFLSPGVTVSFIRASQLTDTALWVSWSLTPCSFCPFYQDPSSHLRVLALTSHFPFVPGNRYTRINERDD